MFTFFELPFLIKKLVRFLFDLLLLEATEKGIKISNTKTINAKKNPRFNIRNQFNYSNLLGKVGNFVGIFLKIISNVIMRTTFNSNSRSQVGMKGKEVGQLF